MPQQTYYTTTSITYVNPDWTTADLAFFQALGDARGSELLPGEKDAYFNRFQAVTVGGSGAFNLTVSADGVTLTSSLLEDVSVPALSMDGQIRYGNQDFRKGAEGDSEEAQTASDTITLLNGSFYQGQIVTILKGA